MNEKMEAVNSSLALGLRHGFEMAWRRRYLILVPLLLSIPLSLVGSAFLSQQYEVRTLLLLQEGSTNSLRSVSHIDYSSNPLTAGNALVERLEGLKALLKSERVLDAALKEIMGKDYPQTGKLQGSARRDLADSLSIKQIGKDFIELHLTGSDPQALGRKLEVITSRFLESLLLGNEGPAAAVHVVLERRKSDVQRAEKALKEFERKIAEEQAGRNVLTKARQLQETSQRLDAKKQELKTVEFKIDKALRETGDELPDPKDRASEINAKPSRGLTSYTDRLIKALLATLSAARLTDFSEVATAKKSQAEPSKIAGLEAKRDRLREEVDLLVAEVRRIEAPAAGDEGQITELGEPLKQRFEEAIANYQSFMRRYSNSELLAKRPLSLVESPENIRVIDPPKDPESPVVARWVYFLAGIVAGLALGCSAAIVAETIDPRLYRPEEFVAIFGAPVICRLPPSQGIDDPTSLEIESARTMHNVTPIGQKVSTL